MYRISNIYVLAAFGTIGGALFGFDISSMSAWIGTEQYLEYFNHPDSNLQGGITASMSAGSFAGAIAAGWIADHLGRRMSLIIASLIWIIGAVIQCSAHNVAHLVAGRVISGLSVGITSSQVCVYLAELAPARIRGRIVGIQQWAIEWGILIMYLISWGCGRGVAGPASFRIAWGVQAVPGLVLMVSLLFFPESPRWLAGRERWEEALDTLAMLHGKGNRDDPVVQAEFEEVKEAARIAHEAKDVTFMALFGPRIWKRTLCGVSVQVWQQLLGGNVAMYYVVYIFSMAGMDGDTSLYSSVIQYVIFLVTTGAILPYIDRIGRRLLLISGAVACMTIHWATAGTMAVYGNPVDSVNGNENLKWEIKGAAGKGVIALSYIFVGIYGFTWAPAGWIYASEVFPLKYRAKGVGLSAAGNWIFNFALAYFVAPAFTNIQWKTYIIFGVFCTVMTFHVFFMYPETAQRSLEEIDAMFDSNVPAWKTAKMEPRFVEEVERRKGSVAAGLDEKGADGDVSHKEAV
ncbi:sugar transporter [Aspergillus egyptiacus]|nr:sugar transporter [Aspergillus egyptiacus]